MSGHIHFGLHAAVSTPVDGDFIDTQRLVDHCRWALEQGAHGICPFGTTGEGVSFSVRARLAMMEKLASAIGANHIMPVFGSCAMQDAVDLVKASHQLGCPGTLMLPPYYFKNPSDDGVYNFYARLIEAVNDPSLRLFVYNIPQVTGVVIDHSIVQRMIDAFGPTVAGIKDSWGKLDHTLNYIKAFPTLAVFTGTDHHIVQTMRAGGAGTVTGMGNVNPSALRAFIDIYEKPEAIALNHTAGEIHLIVEKFGGVPAMKAVIAHYQKDRAWAEVTPPLMKLAAEEARLLPEALEAAGFKWPEV